jgi:hypothetical protein
MSAVPAESPTEARAGSQEARESTRSAPDTLRGRKTPPDYQRSAEGVERTQSPARLQEGLKRVYRGRGGVGFSVRRWARKTLRT